MLGKKQRRWRRVDGVDDLQLVESAEVGKMYVEQMVQQLAWRTQLKRKVPTKPNQYSYKKIKKAKTATAIVAAHPHGEHPKRIVKSQRWAASHTAMSELK
jgi:hypothetical protein